MDNSWDYNEGRSERLMGQALSEGGYRGKVFLMTKIDGRTKDVATRQIETSLQRLKTDHIDLLQDMRLRVGERRRVATCAEFGPRFLHSTGQAYKGGPDSGVFLQITADDAKDLPVPGQKASFGVIKAAQARGDFDVLTERGRRALRVHLKGDLASGLKMLDAAITDALG